LISNLAGKEAPKEILEDIEELIECYYEHKPDVNIQNQKVSFGTSGHRGTSLKTSFNENHIFAITQALCEYRKSVGINGVMHIGIDTHALSRPAQISALQVFLGNEVKCKIANEDAFTPTPVMSFTIIEANKNSDVLNDGVVITPSHNPPSDGGFKYNTPDGGPADSDVTSIIEKRANEILKNGLNEVKALGGKSGFNKNGKEIGIVKIKNLSFKNKDPLLKNFPKKFDAFETHYQTVIKLPAKAKILAKNSKDNTQAARFESNIWGVQFHPEFDKEIMKEYILNQKETIKDLRSCDISNTVLKNFSDIVEKKV